MCVINRRVRVVPDLFYDCVTQQMKFYFTQSPPTTARKSFKQTSGFYSACSALEYLNMMMIFFFFFLVGF